MKAIEVVDVSYSYPDGRLALDGVSISVEVGERVAILGPNGAGKSTLLMVMSGLLQPLRGEVRVLGVPTSSKDFERVRLRIGLVFQQPDDQLFSPTLWEDVAYGPQNMGLSAEEVEKRVGESLEYVGLAGLEHRPPYRLSVGEKKKAALATALAMKPQILLLDEPTANLEPASRTEFVELINRLNREECIAVITATHDVSIVPQISDKVYVLQSGRILREGAPNRIFLDLELLRSAKLEPPPSVQAYMALKELIGDAGCAPLTTQELISWVARALSNSDQLAKKRGCCV